jgi:hypothetical protein
LLERRRELEGRQRPLGTEEELCLLARCELPKTSSSIANRNGDHRGH